MFFKKNKLAANKKLIKNEMALFATRIERQLKNIDRVKDVRSWDTATIGVMTDISSKLYKTNSRNKITLLDIRGELIEFSFSYISKQMRGDAFGPLRKNITSIYKLQKKEFLQKVSASIKMHKGQTESIDWENYIKLFACDIAIELTNGVDGLLFEIYSVVIFAMIETPLRKNIFALENK